MSVIHKFILPLPPSIRDAWRIVPKRGLVPSDANLEYREGVAKLLRGQLPIVGPVVCGLWVYLSRYSGDLSNRLKILEDACEGFLYLDDKQIRGYSDLWREVDSKNPRVVFRVEGERFASRREAEEHRAARKATNEKRKATLRANQAAKRLGVTPAVYR